MEAKQTNSRKKGGLIAAICAAVALIVAIILLLTQCGGLGIKTVSGEELAKNLREPGDSVITLNDNVVITEENVEIYQQIPETRGFSQSYYNTVLLKLMEYAASKGQLEELPESWFVLDGKSMSREQRGK